MDLLKRSEEPSDGAEHLVEFLELGLKLLRPRGVSV